MDGISRSYGGGSAAMKNFFIHVYYKYCACTELSLADREVRPLPGEVYVHERYVENSDCPFRGNLFVCPGKWRCHRTGAAQRSAGCRGQLADRIDGYYQLQWSPGAAGPSYNLGAAAAGNGTVMTVY